MQLEHYDQSEKGKSTKKKSESWTAKNRKNCAEYDYYNRREKSDEKSTKCCSIVLNISVGESGDLLTRASKALEQLSGNSLSYWKSFPQYPIIQHPRNSFPQFKVPSNFKTLTVKCFFNNNNNKNDFIPCKVLNFNENPVEIVAKIIVKALKALQKPAATALLVRLLLMYDPNSALAASGGRMGVIVRLGWGVGRVFCIRDRIMHPLLLQEEGVYVGPAVGIGSSFFLVMIAFAAFVLVSGFLSDGSESSVLTDTQKTSVLKLQVGLLGMGDTLGNERHMQLNLRNFGIYARRQLSNTVEARKWLGNCLGRRLSHLRPTATILPSGAHLTLVTGPISSSTVTSSEAFPLEASHKYTVLPRAMERTLLIPQSTASCTRLWRENSSKVDFPYLW
ncbi:hypothetical protein ACJIZ3_023319 [Penstemon smallii]|uniref:Uncharacterized protein n=1 Tax=Penstemon smallii TaxID=265156 RepID=A0ABD3TRP3_9LAMI